MKRTPSINYSNIIAWIALVVLVLCAVLVIGLALTADTVTLGDPYYLDTILAPQRAFGPWALSGLVIALALMARIAAWIQRT